MGMPGAAEVDAAIDKVIEGARSEGKFARVAGAGMTLNNIHRYKQFADRGVQLLSTGAQEMIRRGGEEFLLEALG